MENFHPCLKKALIKNKKLRLCVRWCYLHVQLLFIHSKLFHPFIRAVEQPSCYSRTTTNIYLLGKNQASKKHELAIPWKIHNKILSVIFEFFFCNLSKLYQSSSNNCRYIYMGRIEWWACFTLKKGEYLCIRPIIVTINQLF